LTWQGFGKPAGARTVEISADKQALKLRQRQSGVGAVPVVTNSLEDSPEAVANFKLSGKFARETGNYQASTLRQSQNGVGAAQVVINSLEDSPDEVAANLKLAGDFARETGNPPPALSMVKLYKPVFERELEKARAGTALSSTKLLGNWMRNPENAAVARDDLENMSVFERSGTFMDKGKFELTVTSHEFLRDLSGGVERSPFGRAWDATQDVFERAVLTNADGTPNWLGQAANSMRDSDAPKVGGPNLTSDQKADAIADAPLGLIHAHAQAQLLEMEKRGIEPTAWHEIDGPGAALNFVADNVALSLPQMVTSVASGAFGPVLNTFGYAGQANAELKARTDLPPEQRVAIASGTGLLMAAIDSLGFSKIFKGLPAGKIAIAAVEGTLVDPLFKGGLTKALAETVQAAIVEGSTEALQEAIGDGGDRRERGCLYGSRGDRPPVAGVFRRGGDGRPGAWGERIRACAGPKGVARPGCERCGEPAGHCWIVGGGTSLQTAPAGAGKVQGLGDAGAC
jgi:Large polyvalent protein associated domain 22